MSTTDVQRAPSGLRERKKLQTRAAIQRHALRLFRVDGYAATTMEQIAAAADISPSTLYRYFPTKEDLILVDDYDPLLAAAFRAQPAGVRPLEALRAAMREVLGAISPEELATFQDRMRLGYQIPEVRAKSMDHLAQSSEIIAELFAERTGRAGDDFAVRVLAGTVVGAMLAAQAEWTAHPDAPLLEIIDTAMGHLIAGPGMLDEPGQT